MIEITPITHRSKWLELRKTAVTASVAAALVAHHPYMTPYRLWLQKTGREPDVEDVPPKIEGNRITLDPMGRGREFELPALNMLAKLRPRWTKCATAEIDPDRPDGGLYFHDTESRIGATPDAIRIDPERGGYGIVQIKTASEWAFKSGNSDLGTSWLDPDTREVTAPTWIAVQATVEAALTGASWACVAPMVVGGTPFLELVEVPLIPNVMLAIRAAVRDFWTMIDEGREPHPDYARDGDAIKALYRDDNGSAIDLSGDNRIAVALGEREALKARESDGNAAERARKVLDAEILHRLGNATIGLLGDGRTIRAPVTRRKGFVVEPTQYRSITIKEGQRA